MKPRYTLDELLAQCNLNAELTAEEREWLDAPLVGKEKLDRPHDDAMADVFRNDSAYAIELLNSILEDGDQGELLIALHQMTKAFGGASKVAEKALFNEAIDSQQPRIPHDQVMAEMWSKISKGA